MAFHPVGMKNKPRRGELSPEGAGDAAKRLVHYKLESNLIRALSNLLSTAFSLPFPAWTCDYLFFRFPLLGRETLNRLLGQATLGRVNYKDLNFSVLKRCPFTSLSCCAAA